MTIRSDVAELLYGDKPAKNGHRKETPPRVAVADPATPKERARLVIHDGDYLLQKEFPPDQFVIDGMLKRGQCYILAANPKKGKSYLGLAWAIACATNGRALGKLPVEAGQALYLDLEGGEKELKRRVRAFVDGTPVDAEEIEPAPRPRLPDFNYAVSPVLVGDGLEEDIEAWAQSRANPVLVVIDTLKKVRPRPSGKGNAYDSDYEAVSPLTDLAHRLNVCVVIVHHTNKTSADDILSEISGSYGLVGAVDGVLVLKGRRNQPNATLDLIARTGGDQQFNLVRDDLTGGWRIQDDAAPMLSDERLRLLRPMTAGNTSWTPAELAGIAGTPAENVHQHLYQALVDLQVSREERGRYRLTDRGRQMILDSENRSKVPKELRNADAATSDDGTPRRAGERAEQPFLSSLGTLDQNLKKRDEPPVKDVAATEQWLAEQDGDDVAEARQLIEEYLRLECRFAIAFGGVIVERGPWPIPASLTEQLRQLKPIVAAVVALAGGKIGGSS